MGTLKKYNWLFPVLILSALTLGTIGFYQYYERMGQTTSWFTSLYLSLQLFVLNSGGVFGKLPILLEIARFMAPAITAGGIFLAIWEPFYKNYLLFRIRFWKNHIVVCGLSKKAELLIDDFIKEEKGKIHIVLIDPNKNHSSLIGLRRKGVIILQGSATDEEELLKANVLHAKFLLALTQDEETNIQIAQRATHLYNQFPQKILPASVLQVILHVDDYYTENIFKEFHEKAVPEQVKYRPAGSKMDYHIFSIYKLAAAYLVDRFSPDQYASLRDEEAPAAHVLILGDTLAAEFLILEAAHMYHFANLRKTKITVVSEDISGITRKMDALYPSLPQTVDIHFVTDGDFFSDQFPIHCDEVSVCFVALDDDAKSIYFARKLRQFIYARNQLTKSIPPSTSSAPAMSDFSHPPIKVLLPRNTALVHIFKDIKEEMKWLNIEMINMDQELCNKKTIVDDRKSEDFIAQHIHYEWAKNLGMKDKMKIGTMEEEWDKLKDAQKDSNRLPARHLNIKLRYVHAAFTDQPGGEEWNIDALDEHTWDRIARMEHNRWMAEKYLNGYVHIDNMQNTELMVFLNHTLKFHSDLVPFDELSKEIQEYDKFTFRMAPVIARLNNKRIIRDKE